MARLFPGPAVPCDQPGQSDAQQTQRSWLWNPTTFTKNRDRLLRGDIAVAFFEAIVLHADSKRLLSDEYFTVDGTLLEAWASQKSFRPRDEDPPASGAGGNPSVHFHGERRTNDTHRSINDPDARLYKKARGREARLGYLGHVLMEHGSGLIVKATVTPADGYGERDAALVMIEGLRTRHRVTVAADVHCTGAGGAIPTTDGPRAEPSVGR